jgi:hypothetical protein
MSTDETEYGLVMPFLPVKSKGGPHDDDAYVAGYEMGLMSARLESVGDWVVNCAFTIHAENAVQADLVAMRHGFVTTHAVEQAEYPGWAQITVTRENP